MKIAVAALLLLVCCVNAAEVHVSPQGDDSNPGTSQKPLNTLNRARDAARKQKDEIKTVILHSGEYRLTKSFNLNARDSRTTFVAAEGADVRISGGTSFRVNDLKSVKDQRVIDRLPQSVRDSVLELALPGKGPGGSETWPLRFRGYAGWPEVYLNGKAMSLARWPNEGYATIAKVLDKGSQPRNKEKPDRGGSFLFKEEEPAKWEPGEPVYLGGYWCFKWYDEFIRVKSIDGESKQIDMAAPHQYGLGGLSKGLYFSINLLEELDQPGEYVYDGKSNKLYILLPKGAAGLLQVAAMKEPLVTAKGAENISFRDLTFENGCSDAIQVLDCDAFKLDQCVIRQVSGTGVMIKGGNACGVSSSHIHTIGKTGVRLEGGDRQTLSPARHYVTDTRIHHFARLVKTYCPAVALNGVGQIVSNNHFHDAPHCAVQFGGNDHQIIYNHIERVCQDTSDAGAIYCGRDWTLGGNRIHGNYIHSMGEAVHHHTWGVYLDDMSSGIEVSSNIIANTSAGVLVGGGRCNKISGNLFINCRDRSLRFDSRGTGWVSKSRTWLNKPDGTMWQRLSKIPFQSGVWAERFPYLAKIENDAYKEPRHNVISGNSLFASPGLQLDKLVVQHGEVEGNSESNTSPEFSFKDGGLSFSEPSLGSFESFSIGPRQNVLGE